jgi:hypothetical protein
MKRPLGRCGCRWEDNIRMDLREIRLEGMDWMHLALDRDRWRALMNTALNLGVL